MCGKTGSGKTVFERWWLQHWYAQHWPILVVDIKKKFAGDPPQYAEQPELATLERPYNITAGGQLLEGCPVQVYQPSVPGWRDARLNRLLLQVLARGNMCVAFDEVNGVADQSHCPLGMVMLLTQGRESNLPTMCCFQRPVKVPTDLLEQSEWFAVFRVNNPDYRKKLAEMTGFPEMEERPEQFYYWLAYENWDAPVMMAPVPLPEEGSRRGAKTVGASSGRLLDQIDTGGGQGRSQVAQQRQRRPAGAGQGPHYEHEAYSHSRLHARARRRAAAG